MRQKWHSCRFVQILSTHQQWQEFLSSVAARDRIGIVAAQDLLIASLELHRPHGISEGPVAGTQSSSLRSSLSIGDSFPLRCPEEGGQDHLQRKVFVHSLRSTFVRSQFFYIKSALEGEYLQTKLSFLQQVQSLEVLKQTIVALDSRL